MHGRIKAHIEWLLLRGCDPPAWHSAMAMPQYGPTPLWVAATLRILSWMWACLPVHRSRCPLRSSMRMLRLSHLGWHAWVCRLWQYLPLARLCAALGLAHPAALLLPTAPLRVLPRPPRPRLGTPCYPYSLSHAMALGPTSCPPVPLGRPPSPRPRSGAGPPLAAPAPPPHLGSVAHDEPDDLGIVLPPLPPRPISVPPPGRPRPRLPRRLPTCPAAPSRFPAIPHRVARGRVDANLPPAPSRFPRPPARPPPSLGARLPPPGPTPTLTCPHWPAAAPVGPGCRPPPAPLLGVKPPSSPPPAPLLGVKPPSSPPPRRQTAPARPNSYIQTTGPPPQWSG